MSILAALILVPALGALAVLVTPSERRARALANGSALFALALAAVASAPFVLDPGAAPRHELAMALGWLGSAPLLHLDGLTIPWLLASTFLTAAALAAPPRSHMDRDGIVAVLATSAATSLLLASSNLALTIAAWVGTFVPGAIRVYRRAPKDARVSLNRSYALLLLVGMVPFVVGASLLAQAGWGSHLESPLDIEQLASLHMPVGEQALPFTLILVAIATRMALFPFHSWLPIFAERGPTGVTVLLVGVHVGAYAFCGILLPLFPEESRIAMPLIADFALLSTLYGALLGLAQHDLKRMVGFVAVSQAGLVTIGIASQTGASLAGALLQSVGVGLGISGLFILVRALEARTGTTDVRRLGGIASRAPRMAGLFALCAIASVGFPGSLGFVGEDLLVHGVLHAHPVVAILMLVAMAINGITLVRALTHAFLGRPSGMARLPSASFDFDLVPRERVVMAIVVGALFVSGLVPRPWLALREATVAELLRAADAAEEAAQSVSSAPAEPSSTSPYFSSLR